MKLARKVKGISPVIATVILVAVTLAIAVAIVGWLFGLWGGLAGGSPVISVPSANLYGSGTNWYAYFYVRNSGAGSDKIIRIELSNGTTVVTCTPTTTGTDFTVSNNEVIIPANSVGWVNATCTGISFTPGQTGILRVHFEKSGVVPINVVAEQK